MKEEPRPNNGRLFSLMDYKKAGLQILAGITFMVVLSFVMSFFVSLYYSVAFLWILNLALMLYMGGFTVVKWLKNCLAILVITLVVRFLNTLGFWGWIAAIVVICAWLLYSRWDVYMREKHKVETFIFGKPIYQFKKDGERVPKVKFKL